MRDEATQVAKHFAAIAASIEQQVAEQGGW